MASVSIRLSFKIPRAQCIFLRILNYQLPYARITKCWFQSHDVEDIDDPVRVEIKALRELRRSTELAAEEGPEGEEINEIDSLILVTTRWPGVKRVSYRACS